MTSTGSSSGGSSPARTRSSDLRRRNAHRATAVASVVVFAFGGCRSAQVVEREALTAALGRDPVAVLRAIGTAPDVAAAKQRVKELSLEEWTGAERLRLLRFGLRHDDERVVFGAVMAMGEQLPVPELRDAAAVVLPRLGDADCPVSSDQARQLIGSGDFAAAYAAVPKLSERDATWFLGGLHRMVRPDTIALSCQLARASDGAVRRAAFQNAEMGVEYSDQHTPLLVATWLELVGRVPDADPIGPGLPGVLSAALRAHLERPEEAPPAEGELDRRTPRVPVVPCARWLVASTPSAADVPLLQELLAAPEEPLSSAATWALGAVDDPAARAVLQDDDAPRQPELWLAARARSGDIAALEALLAGHDEGLVYGLSLATPQRRRVWIERLLELPRDEAAPRLELLGWWASGELYLTFCDPPFEDRYFADLEPVVAAAPRVDPLVLRGLVGTLPCCQTARLADRLLQLSSTELFEEDDTHYVLSGASARWPGHRGVWAFLEVTRPERLRQRLREGFAGEDASIRNFCGEQLVRIGDTEQVERLAAWLADGERDLDHGWTDLANDGGQAVVAALTRRLAAETELRDAAPLLPGLAVALGMPREFAQDWSIAEERVPAVREALLAGDAFEALLQSHERFFGWRAALLARWPDAAPRAWARRQRDSSDAGVNDVYEFDQVWALATDDRAELERMLGPIRDGRYATHYYASPRAAAWAEGLAMLPFWIDQLGSNCCKCVFVEEVLHELFGCDGEPHARSRYLEPAAPWLRRTLLPVADRLRWSRIANAYVVAGR